MMWRWQVVSKYLRFCAYCLTTKLGDRTHSTPPFLLVLISKLQYVILYAIFYDLLPPRACGSKVQQHVHVLHTRCSPCSLGYTSKVARIDPCFHHIINDTINKLIVHCAKTYKPPTNPNSNNNQYSTQPNALIPYLWLQRVTWLPLTSSA